MASVGAFSEAGEEGGGSGSGAPTTATYIVQTPDATLSAEQALSALATGIMFSTTTTGVVSIAIAGTDYVAPAGTAKVSIDLSADAANVPLTIKNDKSESGVELWYTGTVPTGFNLKNASGTLKGGIAIATATNDWITGSAADDIIIHAGATKKIRLGAKAGAAATVSIDCAALATFSMDNGGITNNTSGGINGGMSVLSSGVLKAYIGVWSPSNVLFIGTQGTGGRVSLQMNGVEKLSLAASGDVVVGAGDTAATVLATNATAGFLRLSTCAGTPTGAAVNGAMVLDTTASKLWLRIGGAWVGGTVPGAFV